MLLAVNRVTRKGVVMTQHQVSTLLTTTRDSKPGTSSKKKMAPGVSLGMLCIQDVALLNSKPWPSQLFEVIDQTGFAHIFLTFVLL